MHFANNNFLSTRSFPLNIHFLAYNWFSAAQINSFFSSSIIKRNDLKKIPDELASSVHVFLANHRE